MADDSAAIQKVIDLTFSDEGMTVTTVDNGRAALQQLEQFPPPDVVLADASMPEIGGFELCQIIKGNERFTAIPVVLLISSFEPFDEAQAKAAGADDIVTKPFQSIRDLVSRVGSLLGGATPAEDQTARDYSTLGLTDSHSRTSSPSHETASAEPSVTVLVEAPAMESQSTEPAGSTCAADVELQTADTKKLERISDEPEGAPHEDDFQLQDTVEVEPINYSTEVSAPETVEPQYSRFAETTETMMPPPLVEAPKKSDEALLDLDDAFEETISDDISLDLDFDEPLLSPIVEAPLSELVDADIIPAEIPTATEGDHGAASAETLSAEAIDAIAHRVVEQMSDKVVREIAWEVVPELSELLIKKKLDDQK
ncbi:MAG TPA: response regulator [Pyrinomonadaceae bacterium]|nr:response regulator [Pyrinomonadaceae bacterium]